MNQKLLIIANWKCNPPTQREAEGLLREIKKGIKEIQNTEVVIAPPFIYLPILIEKFLGSAKKRKDVLRVLRAGAQDCFWEKSGAFTGEISPLMLKDMEIEYVILGHSERRKYFKETNDTVGKKIKTALLNKLSPVLCIGETKRERKEKGVEKALKSQLKENLYPITQSPNYPTANLTIAYEPVWAIGTGNFCSPDEAEESLMFIKKEIMRILPREISQNIRILYGGSVDSKNAKDYINIGFKGLLVGGASLIPKEFVKIVNSCNLR